MSDDDGNSARSLSTCSRQQQVHQQQQQQQGAATSAGVLNVARIKRIVKKATGSSKTDMQHAACSQASALELLRIAHTSDRPMLARLYAAIVRPALVRTAARRPPFCRELCDSYCSWTFNRLFQALPARSIAAAAPPAAASPR